MMVQLNPNAVPFFLLSLKMQGSSNVGGRKQLKCYQQGLILQLEKTLAKLLEAYMKEDLEIIPSHYRVACCLSELLCQIGKEYNETANYARGHGHEFKDWCLPYHSGKCYLPDNRLWGYNHWDAAFEGAFPAYVGLDDMLAFIHECLLTSGNNLLHCLFISLGSMEVIAQL